MTEIIDSCLCCENNNLKLVLDLNSQPLANSYLKSIENYEEKFPLSINYCPDCTHIQLTHSVDPEKLFKNYIYVSGTTKTLKEYFDWFVTFTQNYTKEKNILDIACNDGSQLDSYKKSGYNTYGIDPAENLYKISSKNHSIICDYLTYNSIEKFNTTFDVIVAQNVFAHNSYPKQFLEICKSKLKNNGYIFIQTSQADMILNNQFDTIYHEHISFFSVKSFCSLAKKVGLNVVDVHRTPIHGTSFVFVLSKCDKDNSEILIKNEVELSLEMMISYAESCKKLSVDIRNKIEELKHNDYKIIGYGAAAKGNTFINFSKINLEYIVDDNKLKQNLYSPGSKIPIFSSNKLIEEDSKICIIPLSWNFFDEIRENVNSLKLKEVIFLKYFPKIEII
jgi:2-polyprenyl-3-methyl-5-hydroxy-6-metoxy-1,4-benzoquinol methylase